MANLEMKAESGKGREWAFLTGVLVFSPSLGYTLLSPRLESQEDGKFVILLIG